MFAIDVPELIKLPVWPPPGLAEAADDVDTAMTYAANNPGWFKRPWLSHCGLF